MSDIVERLRKKDTRKGPSDWINTDQICTEAADEIEKLRAALKQARRDALEEAARVAEERYNLWHMPHPDDARPFEVCDDASACRDIAAAIRALGEKE